MSNTKPLKNIDGAGITNQGILGFLADVRNRPALGRCFDNDGNFDPAELKCADKELTANKKYVDAAKIDTLSRLYVGRFKNGGRGKSLWRGRKVVNLNVNSDFINAGKKLSEISMRNLILITAALWRDNPKGCADFPFLYDVNTCFVGAGQARRNTYDINPLGLGIPQHLQLAQENYPGLDIRSLQIFVIVELMRRDSGGVQYTQSDLESFEKYVAYLGPDEDGSLASELPRLAREIDAYKREKTQGVAAKALEFADETRRRSQLELLREFFNPDVQSRQYAAVQRDFGAFGIGDIVRGFVMVRLKDIETTVHANWDRTAKTYMAEQVLKIYELYKRSAGSRALDIRQFLLRELPSASDELLRHDTYGILFLYQFFPHLFDESVRTLKILW